MSLPVYHQIQFNSGNIDDLASYIKPEMNLRHPIILNLLELDPDLQRETIGLIENYFVSENFSFLFPYPVYVITVHEPSITRMKVARSTSELPKFFSQKEGRMNVKEGHVAGKNRLLQQEIQNADTSAHQNELLNYAHLHRQIYEKELERQFLRELLSKLVSGTTDG